ncbi:Wadjet anti-phage system protein JetD domain-containing protein [Mucilaginibacter psychrotolerans]|uniref:DUF3322 and DUF2220 domain-containing protein n=1 Tax=Mucilaginibacter psychrotolerans TaxID=1524096 RepID=A0A4Y8SPT1_9SPHI|nr:Wadjet anti-phage system protein JetD domain-containing protein [Mucilaginibacter psychrotolerans]TFF40670.1 hypothetical protein E2R66_00355 [Mucilaginibacter psychrotolerans]
MISPEEIKLQALKWWKPFLQSYIANENFFPRQIDRIGKVKPGQITRQFETLQQEIELLYRESKNEIGNGYLIKTAGRNFRRSGPHDLPDSIEFETADDYLHFIAKKKEWKLFQRNYELLSGSFPHLKGWIVNHVTLLTVADKNWLDIIQVCKYFLISPRPNLYLRQLPIQVHTKFIEDNTAVVQSLLDFLIPDHIRNKDQKRFAERYFLKHDEPLVRIRILDERLALHKDIMDVSIRLSDFEKTVFDCDYVLIAENKMNFLTLPFLKSTIAVWSGGGFNVSYLKNSEWLAGKNIYYWGDIDEHGFQILHQLRSYYPSTKSVMMDRLTYDTFEPYAAQGERNTSERLSLLSTAEAELYAFIKLQPDKNRLEQEKITQYYIDQELRKIIL